MGTTIFARGIPLSAVEEGTTLRVAYDGTAIFDLSTAGISANKLQSATICGSTAASAINWGSATYTGGSSATVSAGTPQAISADRFIKITINSKTFYIPAFASAGSLSAA